jgi:hypothetical protein
MIGKLALHDVNKLVIAERIGRKKEKARVDQITEGVVHDPFHYFAVKKLNSHPYPMDDGRFAVVIQFLVFCVAFETVHIKDGLNIPN